MRLAACMMVVGLMICSSLACRHATQPVGEGNAVRKPEALARLKRRLPLELVMSPVGAQRPDHVVVKLSVINEGETSLVWDSRFSTFICWRVEALDGNPVKTTHLSDLKQPAQDDISSRFVTIEPGCSLSKEIELTKAVQCFGSGHSLPQHMPTGYETLMRFDVPETVNGLRITAKYSEGFDGRGGFHAWFQRSVEEVGLWEGDSETPVLTIPFHARANGRSQ